jgi:hypothetical protein
LDFKAKMDAFTQELTHFALDLRADVDNFDPGDPQWHERVPVGASDAHALEQQFMSLLICVFDSGLKRVHRDRNGLGEGWERVPPKPDASNWRRDVVNDAAFVSWLTVAAWKVLAIPDSFVDPYEDAFWDSWGTWISRDAQALRQEVHSEGEETVKKMTELIVEMAAAKLGRTDTEEKATFEYNRHYHTQLSALLALLQPFADARQRTPERNWKRW